MKNNMKKLISLVLALCLCLSLSAVAFAAGPNEASTNGGSASSNVTLSSTADGSMDGDPAATKMSVTVPTALPIAVSTDGTVTTATSSRITNNSYGAVRISSVRINAASGWKLTAFGDKSTLASEKVDINKFGFAIKLGNGSQKATTSTDANSQQLISAPETGCYMSGNGDTNANSVAISYDAIVTPVSAAVTNTAIASVVFTVEWDTLG